MKKFIKILKAEYKRLFRDPGAVLILVIAVFAYPIVYSIPYAHEVLRDIPVAVVDFDNSELSRYAIRQIDADDGVEVKTRPLSVEDAKKQFYADVVKSYIIIPADFERNLKRNENTSISLYTDTAFLITYRQVASALQAVSSNLGAKIEIAKLMKQGFNADQARRKVLPFTFVPIALFNPSGGYASYIYPVVLILIMQQTMLVGIGLVGGTQREKKFKYTHINRMILAKTLCYVSLYLMYSVFYFFFLPVILSYKVTFNFGTLLILLPFLISTALLGQNFIYFFREREYSIICLATLSLPLLFLPGFIWPKEAMPLWINLVAYFIPTTSSTDALIKMNQMDASFWQVQKDFYVLVFLCIFYYVTAYFIARKIYKYKKGTEEMKKTGFTLAEVLITLAIIGVVAALTIPTVVRNYQKQQTVVRLKKTYNALQNAMNLAIADNGPTTGWEAVCSGGSACADTFAKRYMIPYLKVAKNCYRKDDSDCVFKTRTLNSSTSSVVDTYTGPQTIFLLNDGTAIFLAIYSVENLRQAYITVDANGQKEPNQYGKDQFMFTYNIIWPSGQSFENKVLPYAYSPATTTRGDLLSGTHSCNKSNDGYKCAGLIMKDGWQISDDYPWN